MELVVALPIPVRMVIRSLGSVQHVVRRAADQLQRF